MSGQRDVDRVGLCAQGEHALQRVLYASLGARWVDAGDVATAVGPAPHRFLFGAVTLTRSVDPQRLADVEGDLCDSFAAFRAAELPGWASEPGDLWMTRDPAPAPAGADLPAGVSIRAAQTDADVDRWEAVSFIANGDARESPGALHPAGSLADAGLRMLLAEHGDDVIGTALGVIGPSTLTVSAVAVMPEWRGRGIGGALTRAALEAAPQLPATLSASDAGVGVYRRLGFIAAGRPLRWMRQPTGPPLRRGAPHDGSRR